MNESLINNSNYEIAFIKFCSKYIKDFEERKERSKPYFDSLSANDNQSVRSKISVLVIIPSELEIYNVPSNKSKVGSNIKAKNDQNDNQNEKHGEKQEDRIDDNANRLRFFKNSVDMTNGLLILQLFCNVFGIPFNKMLITTIKDNNECGNLEFCFYQHVNYAQVGNKQFKFLLENELTSRVKLFDNDSIDSLPSDEDSYLFVFLLDHEFRGKFGEKNYQFYIEKLLKIKCKRFIVFNDSCYSTSLIEITKACIDFGDIFENCLKSPFFPSLFSFLSIVGIVNQECFVEIIDSKLDDDNLDDDVIKYKSQIRSAIISVFNNKHQQKLMKLIEILGTNLSGIKCDPKVFIEFGSKATIFTSSIPGDITLALPVRRIHIFCHTQYRICGSIFTSIYIESLIAAPKTLEKFKQSLKKALQDYKRDFQSYIINQNKQINEDDKNSNIASESQITEFFKIVPDDGDHFFSSDDSWPDLGSILTSSDKWNVDISSVNPKEYEDISLGELLIKNYSQSTENNPNQYGPIRRENQLIKFLKDFEKAVNMELAAHQIPREFKIVYDDDDDKIIYNIGIGFWGSFYRLIDPYVLPNLSQMILKLEKPISKFFNEKSEYSSLKVVKLFSEAFKTIFPFWKNFYLWL